MNFLIFLKKFKFIYRFNHSNISNYSHINNLIIIQKKANLHFKCNIFSPKKLKKNILSTNIKKYRVKGKKKNYSFNNKLDITKISSTKIKFFRLKEHFTKKIKLSVKFFKFIFLKKKEKKKKISYFLKNFSTKNLSGNYFNNSLFITLFNSQFFFNIFEIKFFLKKGLVYVNNKVSYNSSNILYKGDIVQLVYSKYYFKYINKIYSFFKKKIKFLKFKKWKFNKNLLKKKYKNWNPKFLSIFFLFKKDIPNNLEIDFTTLSIVYLKNTSINVLKYNVNLLRLLNTYFNKSYSWKRIT